MEKFVPVVEFKDIPLSAESEIFNDFLFRNNWGWDKYIFRIHPRLRPIHKIKNSEERRRFLKEYILGFKHKHQNIIQKNKKIYKGNWKKIEKPAFSELSRIIDLPWPKRAITALISINPICPRFLKSWSFSLFYNRSTAGMREVIMHESCHFLYFEKWKKLFPKTDPKKFEAPHKEWFLSELVAPVILNDPRLNKYIGKQAEFYDEHKNILIKGENAPKFVTNLYEQEENFDFFLKKAKKFIN